MTDVDLNAPAFGPGAQKIEEPVEEVATESAAVEETPAEASAEEPERVKYSRFKKVYDRALEAEREAAEWRARAESVPQRESVSESSETPGWWQELYGDNEASQKAWKIQERANQDIKEEARQAALEAVQSERSNESERIRSNEEVIDQNLEALSDYAGRNLSEREQSQILDIVDEYTPKDDDGNYLGATIPFEKAWDIYELQQAASRGPSRAARNQVASLTGSVSHGEPEQGEQNKSFNPLDWNAWKKRI